MMSSTRYTLRGWLRSAATSTASPDWELSERLSSASMAAAATMPLPTPPVIQPAAAPRRSGPSNSAASPGVPTHTPAAQKPVKASAKAATPTFGLQASRAKPATLPARPIRTAPLKPVRPTVSATTSEPTTYSSRFSEPRAPATVLDRLNPSRMSA